MSFAQTKGLSALAAAASLAAAALPGVASAAPAQELVASARAYTAGGGGTAATVLECDAHATGVAATTEITACYTTNGGSAHLVAAFGPVAATASVFTAPPSTYRVCVAAHATFLVGQVPELTAPLRCFDSQIVGVTRASSSA
jgi:hypothetical protein